MQIKHRSTMYRQGSNWIVSVWDSTVQCYRTWQATDYWAARSLIGSHNCRNPQICTIASHEHRSD